MVTTIKITCDGVFIQSNSYLMPTPSPSGADAAVSSSLERVLKPASASASPSNSNNESDNSQTSSGSQTASSASKRSNRSVGRSHRGSVAQDTRRRYYFGSKDIYWCKQSREAAAAATLSGSGLTRSASSVTHKEASTHATHTGGQVISRARRKPILLCSSLSAAYAPPRRREFYFCDKYAPGPARSTPTTTTTSATSAKHESSPPIDARLLNFLRCAHRKFQASKAKTELQQTKDRFLGNSRERTSKNGQQTSRSLLPIVISEEWFG